MHACYRFRGQKIPQSVFAYIYVVHTDFCMFIWYRSELHMCVVKTGNNQQMIICAFLYTETCSFCGPKPRMHERFRGSKWRIHYSLFPFSRACFHVVKAGRILVPDPATVHCGQRYDRASVAETHACMFIHTRMHSNSDTETVTCMRGLNDGEIRCISMNFVFKRS